MPESERPEILSLEEVREAAETARVRAGGGFRAEFVARLCATVESYVRSSEWEAQQRDLANERLLKAEEDNARLSALVARLREALAEAGFPLEALNVAVIWEIAPDLRRGIREALEKHVRPVLEDSSGGRAWDELRRLRAWEAERLAVGEVSGLPAWQALRAFREKGE